jgi:DNA-binding winged helix-turn-helix (wHTH) protein
MNVANVIPLSASHAVPYAKSGHPAAMNAARVRFDAFELDEADAILLRNGKAVTLAPNPFGVLCALARRPGSLLTKCALLDDAWRHQFVTDSVLKTAISEVRPALDDDPGEPRYIETVSRRGYRFIASTISASSESTPAIVRNLAAGRDHPALLALTALCRAMRRSPTSSSARSHLCTRGALMRPKTFTVCALSQMSATSVSASATHRSRRCPKHGRRSATVNNQTERRRFPYDSAVACSYADHTSRPTHEHRDERRVGASTRTQRSIFRPLTRRAGRGTQVPPNHL